MQGIGFLLIGTFGVFLPAAFIHACIRPVIDLTYRCYPHIKRIATEPEIVKRITHQLFLPLNRILFPLPLQKTGTFTLIIWVEATAGEQ